MEVGFLRNLSAESRLGFGSRRWREVVLTVLANRFIGLRLALSVLFAIAAALKIEEYLAGVEGLGVRSQLSWLLVVAIVEGIASIWLLIGFRPRLAWYLAIVCFSAFGVVSLAKGLQGAASCGCFGRSMVSPWLALLLDMLIVVALLCCPPIRSTNQRPENSVSRGGWSRSKWMLRGMAALMAIAVASALVNLNRGIGIGGTEELAIVDPEQWQGRYLPLLPHIDVKDRLSVGKWTMLLYHHDCAKCQRVIGQYKAIFECMDRASLGQLALVEVPPYKSQLTQMSWDEQPRCLQGRLADDIHWFVPTPLKIELTDGVVDNVSFNPSDNENVYSVDVRMGL